MDDKVKFIYIDNKLNLNSLFIRSYKYILSKKMIYNNIFKKGGKGRLAL